MQVEAGILPGDPETRRTCPSRGQGGQLDTFETGGDIQRHGRIPSAAFDGHWRVAVHLALDVDVGRFGLATVDGADLPVELLRS